MGIFTVFPFFFLVFVFLLQKILKVLRGSVKVGGLGVEGFVKSQVSNGRRCTMKKHPFLLLSELVVSPSFLKIRNFHCPRRRCTCNRGQCETADTTISTDAAPPWTPKTLDLKKKKGNIYLKDQKGANPPGGKNILAKTAYCSPSDRARIVAFNDTTYFIHKIQINNCKFSKYLH